MDFQGRVDAVSWVLFVLAGGVALGAVVVYDARGASAATAVGLLAALFASQGWRLRRMAARVRRESDGPA